ncbi:MAG: hypothetical protein GY832_33675 [Chloroflexi bacterium]|nr:hypothetical protein [Chloroflexota bacterium]
MPSVITDFQLSIETADVLRGQGIDPTRARPAVVAAAQSVLDEAHTLFAPAAIYMILPVIGFEHQRVTLKGGAVFEGPLVARALAGATELVLAVCTAGPAVDERVSALFAAGDPVRSLALEGAGIAAVRAVLQVTAEQICDKAAMLDLRTGIQAEPGQEGWPIRQQRVLFDLLSAEDIGVCLTSSCLMMPRKSISFAIGLGPEMKSDAVACDFCSKRERCQWRHKSVRQD